MTHSESDTVDLHDAAALWSVGLRRSYDIVGSACDALVAGLDSPSLRMLASLTAGEADEATFETFRKALAESRGVG